MEIISSLDNWAKDYDYEVGMEACSEYIPLSTLSPYLLFYTDLKLIAQVEKFPPVRLN